jgi:hypothetical protein
MTFASFGMSRTTGSLAWPSRDARTEETLVFAAVLCAYEDARAKANATQFGASGSAETPGARCQRVSIRFAGHRPRIRTALGLHGRIVR